MTVFVGDRLVVDLVGRWVDPGLNAPWHSDTPVAVYSVGKSVVALLLLQSVDEGNPELEDPVASVWPEFGCAGKESTTVRQALCHRAGVSVIRQLMTNEDLWNWETMTAALAVTEAWWEPGTQHGYHGYHANTYGHLIGEMVHRVTGDLPGTRLNELARPVGADILCGPPNADQARCAEVIWVPGALLPPPEVSGLSGDNPMV